MKLILVFPLHSLFPEYLAGSRPTGSATSLPFALGSRLPMDLFAEVLHMYIGGFGEKANGLLGTSQTDRGIWPFWVLDGVRFLFLSQSLAQ